MGIRPKLHPYVKKSHWFFSGTDEQRAKSFFEYALDSSFDVLWCARGGYGANRLLASIEQMAYKTGIPPRKLLVGFSDITGLMDFVRTRWGWETLHAPMPGLRSFCKMPTGDRESIAAFLRGERPKKPWGGKKFKFAKGAPKPSSPIEAELVGGNLTVWATLMGTPYEPVPRGKIVFFEDVDEFLYRIDRMAQQIFQAGNLEGVKAIVLGDFLNCRDAIPRVIAKLPSAKLRKRVIESPKDSELEPLRPRLDEEKMIGEIFGELGARLGVPVLMGLPVGHGPGRAPLPLGARYRIGTDGSFELLDWNWLKK
jgi:muramoyltetrapeptide carboxypeptidase